MKFSELKGRAVVNLEDAKKIGTIEDLMVEAESHHIAGLKVRTGMFHAPQIIPVADVKNVGGDAVTISTGGMANTTSAVEPTAEQHMASSPNNDAGGTTTATATRPIDSVGTNPAIEITSLLGNKVVTDAGTMVGELTDVMVDWVDLTITGYEVHTGGIFNKAQEFVDAPGVRYGNKLITIPAELLNQPN